MKRTRNPVKSIEISSIFQKNMLKNQDMVLKVDFKNSNG